MLFCKLIAYGFQFKIFKGKVLMFMKIYFKCYIPHVLIKGLQTLLLYILMVRNRIVSLIFDHSYDYILYEIKKKRNVTPFYFYFSRIFSRI
jgi:hypothetical protein